MKTHIFVDLYLQKCRIYQNSEVLVFTMAQLFGDKLTIIEYISKWTYVIALKQVEVKSPVTSLTLFNPLALSCKSGT